MCYYLTFTSVERDLTWWMAGLQAWAASNSRGSIVGFKDNGAEGKMLLGCSYCDKQNVWTEDSDWVELKVDLKLSEFVDRIFICAETSNTAWK